MPQYYPIFLGLKDRRCVIIGAGAVAEGKLKALLDCGAKVAVISPEATEGMRQKAEAGDVTWIEREYQQGDLKDCFLAIAATDDPKVNRTIADEAEREKVLLNVVDQPAFCIFIAPGIVRRGSVTLAVSTGGTSPALARRMKDTLEHCCALEYADLGDVLATTRKEVRRLGIKVTPEDWQKCIDRDLLALAQDGNIQMAIDKLLDCLTQAASSEAAR